MIWGKDRTWQMAAYDSKEKRESIPHHWFAWYPVRLNDLRWCWLENTLRSRPYEYCTWTYTLEPRPYQEPFI